LCFAVLYAAFVSLEYREKFDRPEKKKGREERAMADITPEQTPLVDLLREVPKDLRAEWPSQWAEDGRPIGHTLSPVGKHCHEAAERIAELEAQLAEAREVIFKVITELPPSLELLAVERKGWRRWLFGRWVYSSEPFRRDIQRWAARADLKMMLKPHETLGPEHEEVKRKLFAGQGGKG
jgi:hypothetical protein